MASGSASSRPAARDSSLSPDYAGHWEPTQEPACRMPGGRPSSFCSWPKNRGLAMRGRPGREYAAAFAVLPMTPTVPGQVQLSASANTSGEAAPRPPPTLGPPHSLFFPLQSSERGLRMLPLYPPPSCCEIWRHAFTPSSKAGRCRAAQGLRQHPSGADGGPRSVLGIPLSLHPWPTLPSPMVRARWLGALTHGQAEARAGSAASLQMTFRCEVLRLSVSCC